MKTKLNKNVYKSFLFLMTLALFTSCAQEKKETISWVDIFDGKTLNGWNRTGDLQDYVTQGKIVFSGGGSAVISYDVSTGETTVESNATLSVGKVSQFDFEIYPNPATDIIKLNTQKDISTIKLFNVMGQLVSQEVNTKELNVSKLSTGYYLLKAEDTEGNVSVRKFVKN